MDVHIQIRGTDLTEAMRSYVERRLCFSLGRFASRVGRVSVRISDIDGPRGRVDKACRIDVKLADSGEIVVQETVDTNLYVAIDHATDRIGQTCGRALRSLRGQGAGIRSKKL